jgi:hypothetical protein
VARFTYTTTTIQTTQRVSFTHSAILISQLEYTISYGALQQADELRGSNANCQLACGYFDQEGGADFVSDADSEYPDPEENGGGSKRTLTTMLGDASAWAASKIKKLLHYPTSVRNDFV